MRKVDDGKELFDSVEPYSIQTTAEDILFAERSRAAFTSPVNKKKSFKPLWIGLSSLGAVAVAASILVFLWPSSLTPSDTPDPEIAPPTPFSPMENKTLSQELMTFQAFGPESNETSRLPLTLRNASKGHWENKESSLTEAAFSEIVDGYETVESGIYHIFNEITVTTEAYILSEPFVYNGSSYDYEIIFKDEKGEIDAKLFYRQDAFVEDHHGSSTEITGLYLDHDVYYYAQIQQEEESHSGRGETEVKILLSHVEGPSTVYLIEHETEYRGQQSEQAYSYRTYASINDYTRNKGSFLSSVEIEWQSDRINVDIESPTQEMEFSSIQQKDETHYVFWVEEYETDGQEVKHFEVNLTYGSDASRTYACNEYIEIRN